MCVGEAPGATEEVEGKPFVGPAGNLLDEMLLSQGIQPSEVFYTNLAKERPPHNELRIWFNDQGMPNDVILRGLAELKEEIAAVKPNVILALGNYPLKFLTGKGRWNKEHGYRGIGDYRGYLYEGNGLTGGRKVIPTYHPASIFRDFSNKSIAKLDLGRARRQAATSELRRPERAWVVDPRGAAREEWRQWLTGPAGAIGPTGYPADDFLTCDIEYPNNRLVCVGFTRNRSTACTIATLNAADLEWCKRVLLSGVPLCWQNGMFDASILEWYYKINTFPLIKHDTLYAMHTAYTEYPKDLGFIGSFYSWDEHGSVPYWKDAIDWKKIGAGTQPMSDVYAYNAPDTSETHGAMRSLLDDELALDKGMANTYRFEMEMVPCLWQLSKRGVRIDVQGMQTLRARLEREHNDLETALFIMNNKQPLNSKSGPQVAKFIYEVLGVSNKNAPKTPKGAWMMNDDTLGDLLLRCTSDNQRRGITAVRKDRERRDLISKFCDIELDDDGRMRCHYDPGKTGTGRLSSAKFYPTNRGSNLQNVPTLVHVRAQFISDDGMVFGYADLKQAESLVVSHLSGDPEMLRLHSPEFEATGGDGHKYVAAYLFNKRIEDITKEERYIGKRSRHSLNYHLGPLKFMTKINADAQDTGVSITLQQAKIFIQKYLALHPYLITWWDEIRDELHQRRRLDNLLGRPHIFFDRPDSIIPEATAFKPQSTVADVLNIGLVRSLGGRVPYDTMAQAERFASIAEELYDLNYQPILQVHDAIGYQAPEANFDRVTKLLLDCMAVDITINRRGVEPYQIQIPVDVKAGYNWGEFDEKKPDINPAGLKKWKMAA